MLVLTSHFRLDQKYQCTGLMYATTYNHMELVIYYLKIGANATFVDSVSRRSNKSKKILDCTYHVCCCGIPRQPSHLRWLKSVANQHNFAHEDSTPSPYPCPCDLISWCACAEWYFQSNMFHVAPWQTHWHMSPTPQDSRLWNDLSFIHPHNS